VSLIGKQGDLEGSRVMEAEEHTPERSLDELARGLAEGSVSRREALGWMGGILAATVLASVPGIALTQRAAEAAGRHCLNHSMCCACNYYDETTGAFIEAGTCRRALGDSCVLEDSTFSAFRDKCQKRCTANAPPGTIGIIRPLCTAPELTRKTVCRRRATTGEKVCRAPFCEAPTS
jgi:hypothetical protein